MKAMLTQLALVLGGIVAVISLGWNLTQGLDLLNAVFRATLVFFGTVIVLFIFLRYFSVVMIRFVAEQVMQNRPLEEGDAEAGEGEAAGPAAASAASRAGAALPAGRASAPPPRPSRGSPRASS